MIKELRLTMKKEFNIDLDSFKEFGPRTYDSYVKPGCSEIVSGVDFHFSE